MKSDPPKKQNPLLRRFLAVFTIALTAWLLCLLITLLLPGLLSRANDFFYDNYYHARTSQNMQNREVILVAVDQPSLNAVNQRLKFGWPWPRELLGTICTYLDRAGAKAILFDITFTERSAYEDRTGDDDAFADALKNLKTPVIFGSAVKDGWWGSMGAGTWENFAPPLPDPNFGAVNIGDNKLYRAYPASVRGYPSAAVTTLRVTGGLDPTMADKTFLLHYYGPHLLTPTQTTFTYVPAFNVLAAQVDGDAAAKNYGITPEMFTGKIVILCGTAAATFDLKSSPLSEIYPGPEVHATAIENLLNGQYVEPAPAWILFFLPLLCAISVSAGVIFPKRASIKLMSAVGAVVLLIGVGILLFRGETIRWLPPVESLMVILFTAAPAFAWAYFLEDRQRRFMLKALSKVVSPAIAEQLAADPGKLALGTVQTSLTVLFTDLANFTELSERMGPHELEETLNKYLGEMSDEVLAHDGTLDKYIGDAVMCFWNAPLPQQDHAVRACRAALGMLRREKQLHETMATVGTAHIFTRIGINTASVKVGFIGSDHLFNYTALGDGVNLASRLEGANKLYGTRILISENTASVVASVFYLRKIDVLRVKGKRESMAVYEVMGERSMKEEKRMEELAQRYEAGFTHYQAKRWNEAAAEFLEVCKTFGEDGPSSAMLARIEKFRQNPPEEGWDGVYDSTEK